MNEWMRMCFLRFVDCVMLCCVVWIGQRSYTSRATRTRESSRHLCRSSQRSLQRGLILILWHHLSHLSYFNPLKFELIWIAFSVRSQIWSIWSFFQKYDKIKSPVVLWLEPITRTHSIPSLSFSLILSLSLIHSLFHIHSHTSLIQFILISNFVLWGCLDVNEYVVDRIFDQSLAVEMTLDILSERGFFVSYDLHTDYVPANIDLNTGLITCNQIRTHVFTINWQPPTIRTASWSHTHTHTHTHTKHTLNTHTPSHSISRLLILSQTNKQPNKWKIKKKRKREMWMWNLSVCLYFKRFKTHNSVFISPKTLFVCVCVCVDTFEGKERERILWGFTVQINVWEVSYSKLVV
jgi:hypothetical protein